MPCLLVPREDRRVHFYSSELEIGRSFEAVSLEHQDARRRSEQTA